jgi:hypothetical protein
MLHATKSQSFSVLSCRQASFITCGGWVKCCRGKKLGIWMKAKNLPIQHLIAELLLKFGILLCTQQGAL